MESSAEVLPCEHAEYKTVRQAVMQIVSRLPHRQREALILHYYDGLNVTEVAWAMDITHQSVSRHLDLARKKLKAELEQEPFAGSMGVLAAAPLASLLTDTLQSGSMSLTPSNAAWVQDALAWCQNYIFQGTPLC